MGMTAIPARLIARHGQAATLLRPGEGTDDGYGNVIPGEDVLFPVTVLTATYAVELQLIAAAFLDVGDQRVLVSVADLAVRPETTDKLRIGGVDYEVKRIAPFAPAGTVHFYEMQVRDEP